MLGEKAALRNLEEDNLSIRDKLDAKGFANLPQRLIPDKAAWSIVLAEKARSGSSKCACYVIFTSKEMLPPEITADMVGGRLGLPGDEAVVQARHRTDTGFGCSG